MKHNLVICFFHNLPARAHPLLPSGVVPVVLICRIKNREMVFHDEADCISKNFGASWKIFVANNNLHVGDVCLFEVLECINSASCCIPALRTNRHLPHADYYQPQLFSNWHHLPVLATTSENHRDNTRR